MASELILKQKEEEVKKLAEKMQKSSLILFTDYRGINVADVTELRKNLRNVEGSYRRIRRILNRAYSSYYNRSKLFRFIKSYI